MDKIAIPRIIKNLQAQRQNFLEGGGGKITFLKYQPLTELYPVLITKAMFYQSYETQITLVPSKRVFYVISLVNCLIDYLGTGMDSPVNVASLTITSPEINIESQFNYQLS
ncbi:unnamed protein product [Paramecium sonneborni]|uniref:Uncharacterized protein n=1 Tax=Paramecium sonneborni TaxID=65129 RepID=A0A8S1RJR7_9CILI|nr:unnamed protein product [Paramecium sonneborni]